MDPQVPQPTTQSPVTAPPSYSKIPLIIGAILLLIAVGASSYMLGTKVKTTIPPTTIQPTSMQTLTTNETANWKTYKNDTIGLQFSYPATLKSFVREGKLPINYTCGEKKIDGYTAASLFLASGPDADTAINAVVKGLGSEYRGDIAMDIMFVNNPTNLSPKAWFDTYCPKKDTPETKVISEQALSVGGKSGIIREWVGFGKGYDAVIVKDEKIFFIYGAVTKNTPENNALFRQILSTFKFTDQNTPQPTRNTTQTINSTQDEVNNWKTYRLSDASFKYPSTWTMIDSYPFKGTINREGFTLKCSGPILQNTQDKTTLIAVESINIKKQSDGGFCWSVGDFRNTSKRNVTSVTPQNEASVSEWIPGILLKYIEGEEASFTFQTYDFNEFSKSDPSKNWYEFALIYEKDNNSAAEQTFDQILSTFKFTQ